MKKAILFLLFITSLYSDNQESEAKIYMGMNGGYMHEIFSDADDTTNSAEMAKFKIGYGVREAYAIEFSFDYLKNESSVFSNNDGDKFGLNVELVKAFDWGIYINPYFKVGFGAGYFSIEDNQKNSLNYGSFNTGLGFFIPLNEHLDIEVGYDYKYVSYEKFEAIGNDIKSHISGGYLGFNIRF